MDRRFKEISTNIERYGIVKTAEDIAQRLLNRVVFFKILKCVKIDKVDPEFIQADEGYPGLFLPEATLREFSNDPEYEMPAAFLDDALAKKDGCYGFLNGSDLASYGWYSNKPTETNWPGLWIHFDERYIYMYKGFTHRHHRGKRLHAVGMTRALDAYLARGSKGILSYVEWNNFASLKSCYRMGYSDFGKIYVLRLFNHYFVHADAGCQPYGFRVSTSALPSARNIGITSQVA